MICSTKRNRNLFRKKTTATAPPLAADAGGSEAAARGLDGAELRAAPAVLRDSTGPVAEAEEQEWAAGRNRTIRRGHGRALDGKTRGAALIEQNGAVRTAGSGLGERERERERRCARRGAGPAQGSGPQAPETRPGEPGNHAQQRLPRWPGMTAERPDGGETQHGTWPRPRTKQTRAHASEETRPRKTEDTAQEDRKPQEGEGPGPLAGTRIQGPESQEGRKWPTSPNLPSAAFPDFQGDAGVKFLTDDLGRDKVTLAQWICWESREQSRCLREVARGHSTRSV